MKINENKIKKVVLLMALLAPMVYLFGTLFEALKGSNGTLTLAQDEEEFVVNSSADVSFNGSSASVPSATGYVYPESNFTLNRIYGNSIVEHGAIVDCQVNGVYSDDSYYLADIPLLRSAGSIRDDDTTRNVGVLLGSSVVYVYKHAPNDSDDWMYFFNLDNNCSVVTDVLCNKLETFSGVPLGVNGGKCSINKVYGVVYFNLYGLISSNNATSAKEWLADGVEFRYPLVHSVPIDSSFVSDIRVYENGEIHLDSNITSEFDGVFHMVTGDYVLTTRNFTDFLFNQFFAHDNFLASSGRKVILGNPDYGFKPAGDLIRFVDGNMFHLANVEYGALVIGYTYYAFHVVCVFLIFNLLMFFPHLIENIYDKFERGV